MPLDFPNVNVLGLTQDTRFFDAGFQYASFKRLSIAGTVNALTETFGVTGVWTGQEGLIATIYGNQNYQALILNGVNFGSGRIENIKFEPGLDVMLKSYTASLLVYDSGNLFNFTGLYYSGIDTSNFQYLQSFSEDYSFDKKLNGGYSYTHQASMQFTSGVGQLNSIQAAQSVAKTLFTGSNLGFAFYPGYTNKQGKRYITETYGLIDNVCRFEERFDFDNDNGNYSATQTVSLQLSDNGILTATEQGNIRGIENPNYQKALSAVSVEMAGSYPRCSGAANNYFPTGALLVTSPISQGRSIDIFNNNVNYTVVFNNAPDNQRFYFWDYTLQAAKQNGVSTVTENGTVLGRGEDPTIAFGYAQSGWGIVKTGIAPRCGALFVTPYDPPTNFLDQKQESYAPVQAQVGYTYRYSNDPTLISDSGIRKVNVTEEDNNPNYSYNRLNIFNFAEIAQDNHQATQGSTALTVNMEGDKTVTLPMFLATGIGEINARIPNGNDTYIGNCSYTYSPNEGTTNVQLTWLYNKGATQTLYPSQ